MKSFPNWIVLLSLLVCLNFRVAGAVAHAEGPFGGRGVESLEAWEVRIVMTKMVSTDAESPVYSPAVDKLAYLEASLERWPKTIVIKSLPDLKTEKSIKLEGTYFKRVNGGECGMSWSPDGKRIVMNERFGKIVVVEVETGKQIDLPEVSFNTEHVFWVDQDRICSFYETLDLNTLKISDGGVDFNKKSTHQKLWLEEISVNSQEEVLVNSKTKKYGKVLTSAQDPEQSTRYHFSPNSRYASRIDLKYSRLDGQSHGTLYVLTLGEVPASQVVFGLTNVRMNEAEKAWFVKSMFPQSRYSVYPPKLNPLNNQLIGPTLEEKGHAKIDPRGATWSLSVELEIKPIREGDVVSLNGENWAVLKNADVRNPTNHPGTTSTLPQSGNVTNETVNASKIEKDHSVKGVTPRRP